VFVVSIHTAFVQGCENP